MWTMCANCKCYVTNEREVSADVIAAAATTSAAGGDADGADIAADAVATQIYRFISVAPSIVVHLHSKLGIIFFITKYYMRIVLF